MVEKVQDFFFIFCLIYEIYFSTSIICCKYKFCETYLKLVPKKYALLLLNVN